MKNSDENRRGPVLAMLPLVIISALAVSSLYWAQSVVGQAATEFGDSALVFIAPGATLLGYSLGVAALAILSRDLSTPGGMARHGACLAAALCLAAAAPNAACLALACLAIGAGCAVTQRILVTATTFVAESQQAQAIGTIISAGLLGVMFARAYMTEAAIAIGWRPMFLADAAATLAACLAAAWLNPRHPVKPNQRPPLPSPLTLLRTTPVLRSAAAQQAVAFAAFNMGWSLFPAASHAPSGARAAIATAGACAALLSGRVCRTNTPRIIAGIGLSAIALAAALASLAIAMRLPASGIATYAAMAFLEIGTQIALVANQSRAQAAAGSVSIRGRMAAIVTTIAFGGGAAGAALGNLLQR